MKIKEMKNKIIAGFCIIFGIMLLVNIVYAQVIWGNPINGEFEILYADPVCERTSSTSSWKQWNSAEGKVEEWTTSEEGDQSCYQPTGVPGPFCCPEGYDCNYYGVDITDDDYLNCVPTLYEYNSCEDYTTERLGGAAEDACTSADPSHAAKSIVDSGQQDEAVCENNHFILDPSGCLVYTSCVCKWDSDEDKCYGDVRYSECYDPTTGDPDPDVGNGNCTRKSSILSGDCDTGDFITMQWNVIWEGDNPVPASCPVGTTTKTIKCPIQLVFFTIFSFFISLIIIVFIYFLLYFKKKR